MLSWYIKAPKRAACLGCHARAKRAHPRLGPGWNASPATTSAASGQQADARAKLRAQRDEAIRRAYRDGLPIRDIAAIVELSHQHVSRIARS
jgi:hypothetical protein